MKKYIHITLSIILIIFSGCKKDNSELETISIDNNIDTYLMSINDYILTLNNNSSLELTIENVANWIRKQPFIVEVKNSQSDNLISFTCVDGTSSFVAFENYLEYYDDNEQSKVLITNSWTGRGESTDQKSFNVAKTYDNEMLMQNNGVLCYAPLKWKPWSNKYEHLELFNIANNSPLELYFKYDNSGSFESVKEFGDYGCVLVAETHGYGVDDGRTSAFAIPYETNPKNLQLTYGLIVHKVPFDLAAKGWDSYKYYLLTAETIKSISGLYNNNEYNPIYSVLCCNSFLQQDACAPTSNFIGLKNKSSRKYILSIIKDYYTALFNGYTHEQAVEQCESKSNDDWDTELFHLDFFKDQRYFSIEVYDVIKVDGRYGDVSARIYGWDKLKGVIKTDKWPHIYKNDKLTYMVYYSDVPFKSPDEENVKSSPISWYNADFEQGIIWGHYAPDNERKSLLMQTRILGGNSSGKRCYYTLGFEYTDDEGNKKIYYGEVKSFVTLPDVLKNNYSSNIIDLNSCREVSMKSFN